MQPLQVCHQAASKPRDLITETGLGYRLLVDSPEAPD